MAWVGREGDGKIKKSLVRKERRGKGEYTVK